MLHYRLSWKDTAEDDFLKYKSMAFRIICNTIQPLIFQKKTLIILIILKNTILRKLCLTGRFGWSFWFGLDFC